MSALCSSHSPGLKLVVLTGGPGAGKTTVLDIVRHMFSEHVIVLHEAASMIYNGGFIRRNTSSAVKAAQRSIYHIQREQERILEEEGGACLGLCDRGTLDGLAYWPGERSDFFRDLNTTEEQELKRYAVVIHMRTPSVENGYDHSNPARVESPEAAAKLDQKMIDIWKNHPNHFIVDSCHDFLHKTEEVIRIVSRLIDV